MATKIVNGFVWLLVTDIAKDLFPTNLFSLYVLHSDGSESFVYSYAQINDAQEFGLDIGIEVSSFNDLVN